MASWWDLTVEADSYENGKLVKPRLAIQTGEKTVDDAFLELQKASQQNKKDKDKDKEQNTMYIVILGVAALGFIFIVTRK